ncbi:hypothetical protein bAD24_I03495 [Burkholderia sp. AD24]|nr:hypothetical protein bAD24_I03495 [Burkholderia sp. AD24]
MKTMQILAQFHSPPDFAKPGDFVTHLTRMWTIIDALVQRDTRLAAWYLQADTEDEARLYPVFVAPGAPSTPALAVLSRRYKGEASFAKVVGIWNGHTDTNAATASLAVDTGALPEEIEIDIPLRSEHGEVVEFCDFEAMTEFVAVVVKTYRPLYVSVGPREYFYKQVFDDRPGVGWMLYLPRIVTMQQVPEARALIPVHAAGKQQTGTIIVSVTDTVFSTDNPEHIEIANRIEIRLIDQGLLPRYADL